MVGFRFCGLCIQRTSEIEHFIITIHAPINAPINLTELLHNYQNEIRYFKVLLPQPKYILCHTATSVNCFATVLLRSTRLCGLNLYRGQWLLALPVVVPFSPNNLECICCLQSNWSKSNDKLLLNILTVFYWWLIQL